MPRFPVLLALGILAGLAGGVLLGRQFHTTPPAAEAGRKILYWWDPMIPSHRSDRPGKSPMGMEMVPVYEGDAATAAAGGVSVAPGMAQNLGLRTAVAETAALTPSIETFGLVGFDESRTSHVHVRTKGWVERLHHRVVGETVDRGDILFEFFSPDLASAAFEYVRELERASAATAEGARRKLVSLGMDERQIEDIRRSRQVPDRVRVYATQSGAVVEHNVAEGMYVEPDATLMVLTELASVWVVAELFEGQANLVHAGQSAEIAIKGLTGRHWSGVVDYVYPDLRADTRTVRLRIRLDNADRMLRPDMFATVRLRAEPRPATVVIPRSALIRTGAGERVVVMEADGRYRPTAVTAGLAVDEQVEILGGLSAGDRVVISGQFLLDSESSLTGGLARLAAANAPQAGPVAWTEATVNGVAGDKVNLSHPPIPAIQWPAMTMDFAIDPTAPRDRLKPGAKLCIGLATNADGTYRVLAVEPPGRAP